MFDAVSRFRSFGLQGIALLFLLPLALLGQSPGTGTIRGEIRDAELGTFLGGVTVQLLGTSQVVHTDGEGAYRFVGVPAGSHGIRVRYLGLEEKEARVEVRADEVTVENFSLAPVAYQLAGITVQGQVSGQAAALNRQRTAVNIRDVASRDALARVRDGQIGEAVNAIPGVYMDLEILSPTRPVIRGLADGFNSVTVDGIRLGDQGGGRSTRIRYYPGEIVGEVEVIKAVTPDMEGDAIGGTVNLVSRRAIEQTRRHLQIGAGGSYNNIQDNFNRQVNFSFGDRFLRGRFAVFLTTNLYEVNQGYPEMSTGYAVSAEDRYRITNLTAIERMEEGSRTMNAGLTTDIRPAEHTLISLRGSWLRDARRLEDVNAIYTLGTVVEYDDDRGVYEGGRVDLRRNFRHPVSGSQVYGVQVEHTLDRWTIDYRGAYSQATNSYDRTFIPLVRSQVPVSFAYDRSVRDFPALSIRNGFDLNDAENYGHQEIQRTQAPSIDKEYSLDLNLLRTFAGTRFEPYVKAGARTKFRRFEAGDDDAGYYNYVGERAVPSFMTGFDTEGYMPRSDGRALFPTINPHFGSGGYEDLFFSDPSQFQRQDDRSELLLANRMTHYEEDITAGYVMGGAKFGTVELLGGVRVEATRFRGFANQVETEGGKLVRSTPTRNETDYVNVLPGIHATWNVNEGVLVRGSINRTLARPNGRSMQPVRTVNEENRTLSDGNPDLEVTRSTNYDLALQYYIRPLGLASIGVFHKEIDGFYTSITETVQEGEYAGYDRTRPAMGHGGTIRGIELGWQQRLTFLPGALSDFGISLNGTFLEADGRYPNRTEETLPFAATSRRLLNANLFYERGGVDLRMLYNWRDRYLTSIGSRPALDRYQDARGTLDLLASYRMANGISVNLDWKNITDSPIRAYQGSRENPTAIRFFDYAILFGVKVDL